MPNNQLRVRSNPGLTLYVVLEQLVGSTLEYYNTVTPGLEAYNSANWTHYAIALTEGAPGQYAADAPAGLAAGNYAKLPYQQLGGSAATTDAPLPGDAFNWTGTANVGTLDVYNRVATASQIATAVWTDTTGSDFTTAGSPGKILTQVDGNGFLKVDAESWHSVLITTSVPLAASAYTAPDNSHVATILSDVGELLTDVETTLFTRIPGVINPQSGDSFAMLQAGGATVVFVGPVVTTSLVCVVAGDDYLARDSRAFQFNGTGWPDLTGASVRFYARNNDNAPGVNVAGSVITPTGTACVQFDLPRGTTATLVPGSKNYDFAVVATLANADVVTLTEGQMSVGSNRVAT